MSRKSLYLACVLASVPASARDVGTPSWQALLPARGSPVGALADFDVVMAVIAGLAVAIGLAWRRL